MFRRTPRSRSPEEPHELALRLQQGDQGALEAVLRTLGPRVAGGLKKRHPALTAEDLEDVLSVASHRLWERRDKYDVARGSLAAWFFIIADNLAKDLLKSRARRPEHLVDLSQLPEVSFSDPTSERETSFPDKQHLDDILRRLTQIDHRILSVYADTGGSGHWAADLAEELGIRPGTIRVRCSRLKEKIRKELQTRTATARDL
jgi:RNA polymerase sigma factor (sigma-70 family)